MFTTRLCPEKLCPPVTYTQFHSYLAILSVLHIGFKYISTGKNMGKENKLHLLP